MTHRAASRFHRTRTGCSRRRFERVEVANLVREPDTALSADAYNGLRKQVIAAVSERIAHLQQLVQFRAAVEAGASSDELALVVGEWCEQSDLEVVTDTSLEGGFDSSVRTGRRTPPRETAYVDRTTGRVIRQGSRSASRLTRAHSCRPRLMDRRSRTSTLTTSWAGSDRNRRSGVSAIGIHFGTTNLWSPCLALRAATCCRSIALPEEWAGLGFDKVLPSGDRRWSDQQATFVWQASGRRHIARGCQASLRHRGLRSNWRRRLLRRDGSTLLFARLKQGAEEAAHRSPLVVTIPANSKRARALPDQALRWACRNRGVRAHQRAHSCGNGALHLGGRRPDHPRLRLGRGNAT